MAVKTRYSKQYLPKRPRLKKRSTKESKNAFWQEYAQSSKTRTTLSPRVGTPSQFLPSLKDLETAMDIFGITVPQSEKERYSEFLKKPLPASIEMTMLMPPNVTISCPAKKRPSKKPVAKRSKSRRSTTKAPINL